MVMSKNSRGVDWPNGADLAVRFGVLLELLEEAPERLIADAGVMADVMRSCHGAITISI
jgi:hypothetical protein